MFESPVLGLAKDCNQTGLRPNKTKTKKDCLLVFCSLGLGLFILETSKRPKKTVLNRSFLGLIMYILTTILGLFLVILSYFFGIYSCRFTLTREYSTCHPEMWISPLFLGQITWSNALNVAKGRYYNPPRHPWVWLWCHHPYKDRSLKDRFRPVLWLQKDHLGPVLIGPVRFWTFPFHFRSGLGLVFPKIAKKPD